MRSFLRARQSGLDMPPSARALDWQERNLSALLRSARTGKPMGGARPRRAVRMLQQLLFE